MTGITRISKESVFSDLNNLKAVTSTSDEYAASFGFTEEEVFAALEEYGLSEKKEQVKYWYDGFIFGEYQLQRFGREADSGGRPRSEDYHGRFATGEIFSCDD